MPSEPGVRQAAHHRSTDPSREPPGGRERKPPARRSWATRLALPAVLVLVVVLLHHRVIDYARLALDSSMINDDARPLIYPLLRYHDPALLRHDYAADYVLDILPVGYRALYAAAAAVWDPRWVSKALPVGLLIVLMLAVGAAARRLGGLVAAGAGMALVLASDLLLARLTGGLSRAFAFPLLALAAVALVNGRATWLAALVPVGFAFYPSAGVTTGLALAALLLVVPRSDRGDATAWGVRRGALVLAAAAALAGLVALPTAMRLRPYGPVLRSDQVAAFPENGPAGRFGPDDRAPFPTLLASTERAAVLTFEGKGPRTPRTWPAYWERRRIQAAIALAVVGGMVLSWRDPAARRLLALAAAAVAGDVLARLVSPYLHLPQRYTLYAVPVLLVVLFPAGTMGLAALAARAAGRLRAADDVAPSNQADDGVPWGPRRVHLAAAVATALAAAIVIVPMRLGVATEAGFKVRLDRGDPLYAAVSSLPPDAVVAGWPKGILENVPYVTGRAAYVTFETHQAFHAGYALEMRRRMRLLIDAYFARDLAPLRRLRDEGATHLLVERAHFAPGAGPPWYFAPFDAWVADARAALAGEPPAALDAGARAIVFDDGRYALLDLRRLPPEADGIRRSPP